MAAPVPSPSVRTPAFVAGVAALTAGNILTLYGAYLLREVMHPAVTFTLFALPLFAAYALAELRGYRLSRAVGLPVGGWESPLVSAGLFAVLGVGWLFIKAGQHDRRAVKAEAAVAKPNAPQPFRAPGRESVETLVFVVVLVLLLKLFVVEAFVIPTGSMAETMYGYNKRIKCRECGYQFAVNASDEAEPRDGRKKATSGYCCPNCRYTAPTGASEAVDKDLLGKTVGSWLNWPDWSSGDRVLVTKFLPVTDRGRVVVFKYPDEPQTGQVPQNYIKRLVGLSGETIAVYGGDLYVTKSLTYPEGEKDRFGDPLYPRPDDPNNQWRAPHTDLGVLPDPRPNDPNRVREVTRVRWNGPDYRYANADAATALFAANRDAGFAAADGFQIVRKPDDLVLEMRRIVYSNDHQSAALIKEGLPPRWLPDKAAGDGWAADNASAPKVFSHSGDGFGWVRYQHLLPNRQITLRDENGREVLEDGKPVLVADRLSGWEGTASGLKLAPQLITNFMGYNAGFTEYVSGSVKELKRDHLDNSDHWAGDLLVECSAAFTGDATLVLELSKGEYRHRAEFKDGQVRVKRFSTTELVTRPDGSKASRGATVPAGDDEFVLATARTGIKPGGKHRLRFANVDCRLRVWVDDTPIDFGGKADYPPPKPPADGPSGQGWVKANDVDQPASVGASGGVSVSAVSLWRDTHYVNHPFGRGLNTFYVQPGHYLCMGDNSAQSSDGRMWGLVPERLMLGRAVFTFFPFDRLGFIR